MTDRRLRHRAPQRLRLIRYSGFRAIAPGVVLIKAPGHTPGSQMVHVRLTTGSEYIFMGDAASMEDNVTSGHIRSRLVTKWISHDDRAAVLAQVVALLVLQGVDDRAIRLAVERAGLDLAAAARRAETPAIIARADANLRIAEELGFIGTPHVVVDGVLTLTSA